MNDVFLDTLCDYCLCFVFVNAVSQAPATSCVNDLCGEPVMIPSYPEKGAATLTP